MGSTGLAGTGDCAGLVLGVRGMARFLEQWQIDAKTLRRRMILTPTPRERYRWYVVLLLELGWTAAATAETLEREPHNIGQWRRPAAREYLGSNIRADRRFPPPLMRRSRCLNYLHRLGFVLKRTRKRLVKANGSKREAFVAEYAGMKEAAKRTGANIFITDEAHFRPDCKLLRERESIDPCRPTVRRILAQVDIGSSNLSGEDPASRSPDAPDGKWVAPATVLPTVGTPQGHRRRGLSSCR